MKKSTKNYRPTKKVFLRNNNGKMYQMSVPMSDSEIKVASQMRAAREKSESRKAASPSLTEALEKGMEITKQQSSVLTISAEANTLIQQYGITDYHNIQKTGRMIADTVIKYITDNELQPMESESAE